MVAGALELPDLREPRQRVIAGPLRACPHVEGPRLGVEGIADHQRPDSVADGLGPKQRPVLLGEHRRAAGAVLPAQELRPEVAIVVRAAEDQHALRRDGRQHAVSGVSQVHRRPPDHFTRLTVESHGQPHVGAGQLLLGGLGVDALLVHQLLDLLRKRSLTIIGVHTGVGEEHAAGIDGQCVVADVRAQMRPLVLARPGIDGEHSVGLLGLRRGAAVERIPH